jgi:hypothetical protein
MALFLVTPLGNNYEGIKEAIQKSELDMLEVQNNAGFMVNFEGTSFELSNKIGLTNEDRSPSNMGAGLITAIGSYYGIANTFMWEWMKNRLERSN